MALSEALQQKVNNVVNAIKTLISNHNTSNTAHTDIRNAIEHSKNIYPDVIKKELINFDIKFKNVIED